MPMIPTRTTPPPAGFEAKTVDAEDNLSALKKEYDPELGKVGDEGLLDEGLDSEGRIIPGSRRAWALSSRVWQERAVAWEAHLVRERAQHENTRLLQAGSETALREARAHTARVTAELAELREAVGMPAPAEEDMRPTIERVEPTPDPVRINPYRSDVTADQPGDRKIVNPVAIDTTAEQLGLHESDPVTIEVGPFTILDTAGDEAVQEEPTPDPVTAKLLHHRETSASVDTAGDEDVQEALDQEAEPSREAYHRSPLGLFEAAAKEIRAGFPATHAVVLLIAIDRTPPIDQEAWHVESKLMFSATNAMEAGGVFAEAAAVIECARKAGRR